MAVHLPAAADPDRFNHLKTLLWVSPASKAICRQMTLVEAILITD